MKVLSIDAWGNHLEEIEPEPKYKRAPMSHHKRGLMYTPTGYGNKIPTEWKVLVGKRWYRVYCHIFSNCGCCYILAKGKRLYIKYEENIQEA